VSEEYRITLWEAKTGFVFVNSPCNRPPKPTVLYSYSARTGAFHHAGNTGGGVRLQYAGDLSETYDAWMTCQRNIQERGTAALERCYEYQSSSAAHLNNLP
jgi:hypothetical protein